MQTSVTKQIEAMALLRNSGVTIVRSKERSFAGLKLYLISMLTRLHFYRQTWMWLMLLALSTTSTWAQVSLTSGNLTQTQDFNTLATSSTSTALPTGVLLLETGTNANAIYTAGTGSSNAGDTYSFGAAGSTDRALGAVASGSVFSSFGILFTNNTGSTITSLSVTYTGEQWRNGGNVTAQKLDFAYATGSTLTLASATTNVDALDFTSPTVGATAATLDGNAAANRTTLTQVITFATPIADGQQILLKWTDANDTGNDHGLAIDDLTVTATVSGPPAAVLTASPTSLTGANGLTYTQGNGPVSGIINISGANLTPADGTITVTSTNATAFSVSPATVVYTGSTLASTPVTVQLLAGLAPGEYAGTVTFEGTGTTAVVPVSGTVIAANAPPALSINDGTLSEGNSGSQSMIFTVSLSGPAQAGGVTFDISTVGGSATSGSDFVSNSLTVQTIPSGQSSYTFAVTINGDTDAEPTESFSVVVSNVVGANVTDGVGVGTITNDDAAPATLIRAIQGSGHVSPLASQTVANVAGIVTVVRSNGFWMQDPNPDADDNTSEGIFVFTSTASGRTVGESVLVNGTVQEFRANVQNLSLTQITSPAVTVVSANNTLPAPIVISSQVATGVRRIPTNVISNDFPTGGDVELSVFDPTEDGLDFFETLEGMRVQINNPVTTSFRNNFGEVFVIADAGAGATGLNSRKTLTISGMNTTDINSAITNSDFNPERLQIDDVLYGTGNTPNENIGTLLNTIVGVVNYDFQNYEILPSVAPTVSPSNVPLTKETTNLAPTTNQLTIASFNVENLAGNEPQAKYDGLAAAIKTNLASPDILALEEIQDNNGATNNGEVDATTTLNRLVAAITAAGGPTYEYRQINPVNGQDGGEPGGNIRVGLLFNPARVQFVDRPGGGPAINTTVSNAGGQPVLSASPGRILDTNPGENDSYAGDDFTATRKPLVGEFTFNGQTVYLIVNHFSSRGGSGVLTQRFQPPLQSEQGRREEQGKVVNAFVDQLLAVNPNTNVVVLGDFNEFQFLPALQYLKGNVNGETPVLTNLIETLPVQERYTYSFDGNAQALDYILASNAMSSKLDGFDAIHINAEFLDQLSDHDPSVARFTIALTTPPSGTVLALLTPTYNCATGDITFNTSGGDGTTITYSAIGVQRSSPTSNVGVVEPGLRADAKPLTISATQSGTTVSITFDFAAFCASPPSSTTSTPPSNTTSTPGTGQPLALLTPTYTCATGDITFNTSGGDGTTITYTAVGVQRSSPTSPNGVVEPGLRADAKPLTISATQSGATVSITFDFAAFCSTPPSSTTSTPPSNTTGCGSPANTIGQTLQVTGVTDANCQTGTFRILTTGGNGQSISYANNVGLSNDDPTNCVRRVDNPGLVQAINNPGSDVGPFELTVMQGATQSNTFTFNFKQFCTAPARVATESLGELTVTVLGNPTLGETVEVIVSNTAGEAVTLQVTNAQGQAISRVTIESTSKAIRQRLELGRSVGLYLLQVNTPTRTKTVKVVRQ